MAIIFNWVVNYSLIMTPINQTWQVVVMYEFKNLLNI